MIKEELGKRKLPELLRLNNGKKAANPADWKVRREEILTILRQELYGFSPEAPDSVRGVIMDEDRTAYAGKAVQSVVSVEFNTPRGVFCFKVTLIVPLKVKKPPVFLNIAFRPDIPDKYLPVEELVDSGYAIASFYYEDVSPDKDDGFATGLPAAYPRDPKTGWGKISVWAWAASRVMDYLCTRDDIDTSRVAVAGHSRLGKTALWCGAQDERFSLAISNDSGCAGAALFRNKTGEHISFMAEVIPYWFCGNYGQYADRENELPYDQHFLLALMAPRALCVGSASEDDWADGWSEFLSCAAASEAYELLGLEGLSAPDEKPAVGTALFAGNIGYQLREGLHYFSRTDWQHYMEFRKQHDGEF